MERVYGIEDRDLFFNILEHAFLPDLRAATMLEKPDGGESEMGLALNRFIGNSILPALIKYNHYYAEADNYNPLLEATLHTVYQLSKGKMLTNVPTLFLYHHPQLFSSEALQNPSEATKCCS